ncbi:hypothetical protein [Bellilinea caldifistulae]|uniref:hypothetical protein n=1 Tax=Bellilinea caldifistulae TaxID=360411 RepID=UPI0007824ABD|nr:hypothetical protein [Bellilinea caldifistulae]
MAVGVSVGVRVAVAVLVAVGADVGVRVCVSVADSTGVFTTDIGAGLAETSLNDGEQAESMKLTAIVAAVTKADKCFSHFSSRNFPFMTTL